MNIFVDSHQHFWDPVELGLPAPPPEAAVFGRAFMPADLEPELRRVGVGRTVLVQAFPQSVAANAWLFRQANASDFVAGVVAWLDLENPAGVAPAIQALCRERKFAGVRHIVEDEPDVNWIMREPVLESLGELARLGVCYDMLVKPPHLKNVLSIIDKVPGLRMVIDHIAKPNMAGGGSPGWAEQMSDIAKHSRIFCKVSGLITEADHRNWKPADLAPFVHHVIEVFGWDRVMYGSDWPVCLLAGSYQQVWNAIHEILGNISDTDRAKLFGANAIQFYGLTV